MNPASTPLLFPDEITADAVPREEASRLNGTFWLTRFVLLRLMGLVYFTAFLITANQIIPLVGHHGILPADRYLPRVHEVLESRGENPYKEFPTLFWWKISDELILQVSWAGLILSALVLCGYANSLIMLLLWALYMSVVNIGQDWYGYGWDTQILETGFICAFLCPFLDPRPFSRAPPSVVAIWLFRWLIFRMMLGAGLIKWNGDPCWKDLTALYYHYETQPLPNPLSRTLHFMPQWFQQFGVIWNFFIELYVPWLLLWPPLALALTQLRRVPAIGKRVYSWRDRRFLRVLSFCFSPSVVCTVAGLLMGSFQVILICSGNLAFLNWLTLVPCIACIDDSFWRRVLPGFIVRRAERADREKRLSIAQWVATLLFAGVTVWLSIPVVKNLCAEHQDMNASYDLERYGINLRLSDTYGAFGSVTKERYEIVFEGAQDISAVRKADWREYQFKAKPGDVMRRPPIITPYYYRLDWQAWFASFEQPNTYQTVWVLSFVWKLLHNDSGTLGLLANNPFPDKPPQYIRAVFYRYRFAPHENKEGAWWTREFLGLWMPEPLTLETPGLKELLIKNGMADASEK